MFKPFNYYGRWGGLLQLSFDLVFLTVLILAAVRWIEKGLPADMVLMAVYGAILLATLLAFRAWLKKSLQRLAADRKPATRSRLGLLLYLAVPAAYGIAAVLPLEELNRQFLEFSALTMAFAILTTRVVALPGTPAAVRYRILVFGVGERAQLVQRALRESDPLVEIVGFYPSPAEEEVRVAPAAVLPASRSLCETATELHVDSIVVAVAERRNGALPLKELLDCRLGGVSVLDLQTYFERTLGQIRLDALYAGWLVFGTGFRQGFLRTAVKRLFDIGFASLLLVLALPVMVLAAMLIVCESGFPVFYRQERVGLNGRLFNVIKFRSMRTDAEKDGTPRWASAGDSRVTRVGRVIRKLRIDELPQLLSVLKGDMSLVGPRPERPYFVDQLMREVPFYGVRHSIKPGLTGWAQVRYHYGATVEDSAAKLQYDLYYVKNHCLTLDLLILLETVGVVLTAKGAQ